MCVSMKQLYYVKVTQDNHKNHIQYIEKIVFHLINTLLKQLQHVLNGCSRFVLIFLKAE